MITMINKEFVALNEITKTDSCLLLKIPYPIAKNAASCELGLIYNTVICMGH